MPSPGKTAIANSLGNKPYTVEGGFSVTFKQQGDMVQKLSTALDNGWTSATPSTTTTMATAIINEFTLVTGNGLVFLTALGTGIDNETSKWAASVNPLTTLHTYAPTAPAIVTAIMAASPVQSAGALALAELVSNIFIANFEQEAG